MQVRATENGQEIGKCGCGRSPSGKCIGWHALSEDEWLAGKVQLEHNFKSGHGKITIETGPDFLDESEE